MEFKTSIGTDFDSVNTVTQEYFECALNGNSVHDTNPPDLNNLFDGASKCMGSLAANAGIFIVCKYIAGPEQNFNRVLEYMAGGVMVLGRLFMVPGAKHPEAAFVAGLSMMSMGGLALWRLKF